MLKDAAELEKEAAVKFNNQVVVETFAAFRKKEEELVDTVGPLV